MAVLREERDLAEDATAQARLRVLVRGEVRQARRWYVIDGSEFAIDERLACCEQVAVVTVKVKHVVLDRSQRLLAGYRADLPGLPCAAA